MIVQQRTNSKQTVSY